MSDPRFPYHESLTLKNFTAFSNETLDFVPGINVLIGENGTGKTHVMKALYAWQIGRHLGDPGRRIRFEQVFPETYGVEFLKNLLRGKSKIATVSGKFGDADWSLDFQGDSALDNGVIPYASRPVFIPAIEMMAHARNMNGVMRDYADFDRTCFDFLAMLQSEPIKRGEDRDNTLVRSESTMTLQRLIPGAVEWNEGEQRFYLRDKTSNLPFPLVAEGVRKVAALYRLIDYNWIAPGGVLFWDEPEVNINPNWMDEIIEVVVALASTGVQIFLSTHSYVILKQINLTLRDLKLRTGSDVPARYFSLYKERGATKVTSAENFASLVPNSILDQYDQMLAEDWRLADAEANRR